MLVCHPFSHRTITSLQLASHFRIPLNYTSRNVTPIMLAFLGVLPLLLATSATPIQKRDDSFYVTNSVIESGRDGSQCLIATKAEVGAPVTTGPCQGTPTDLLYWNLNEEGSGSLILTSTANSGSPLALDAGSSPENFGSVKLWTSYPGLYQQT